MNVLRLLLAIIIAFFCGKGFQKFRMPSILGWLITGMLVGPHALGLISSEIVGFGWYSFLMNTFEICVGILIGSELILKQLKKSGRQIVITTLFQSVGTFIVVTASFAGIFFLTHDPLYLAFLFGGIALATAPAPALSIVQEYKTKGPVTDTLIPMAVLDDVVGIVIFFSITSILSASFAETSSSLLSTIAVLIGLPIVLGGIIGLISSLVLRKKRDARNTLLIIISFVIGISVIGFLMNTYVLGDAKLNFMLMGMSFAAVLVNRIPEALVEITMSSFAPVMNSALLVVIVNLGIPLDYHLIFGAGFFTAVYIISRALGKYFGARTGAKLTGLPKSVQKYLGFTLLPHSGVSLVFTGIAVSTLRGFDPNSAILIQGTIAAAAIINEFIAVFAAKEAFKKAGEIKV